MTDSVHRLESEVTVLKRGSTGEPDENARGKRRKVTEPVVQVDGADGHDDIDVFLATDQDDDRSGADEDNILSDLKEFYAEEGDTGDNISNGLAAVLNQAMRGGTDKEKMTKIRETYKRPDNLTNIQVPRIDTFLWRQLKHETRTSDVLLQRSVGQFSLAMVPVARAMDLLHAKTCNEEVLKGLVVDTFKIICDSITTTNQARRDNIKKELNPRFKSLCGLDQPISATKLFGDKLQEDTKALDDNKVSQYDTDSKNVTQSKTLF